MIVPAETAGPDAVAEFELPAADDVLKERIALPTVQGVALVEAFTLASTQVVPAPV